MRTVIVPVSGCATPTPSSAGAAGSLINGLLLDSDGQGFHAFHTGGACDGPARLVVTETPTRVDLSVKVEPDPSGTKACIAVGINRTVSARVEQLVGDRPIFAGGHRQFPFDGSRTLRPSTVPQGFTHVEEGAGTEPTSGSDPQGTPTGQDADTTTTRWTVTYTQPDTGTGAAANTCTPSRGSIQIGVAPPGTEAYTTAAGWIETSTVTIGGHPARLLQNVIYPTAGLSAYVWEASQGTVTVSAAAHCAGDDVVGSAELLHVAQSLQ